MYVIYDWILKGQSFLKMVEIVEFKSLSQDWKQLKPLIEPKTTDLAHLAVKQISFQFQK